MHGAAKARNDLRWSLTWISEWIDRLAPGSSGGWSSSSHPPVSRDPKGGRVDTADRPQLLNHPCQQLAALHKRDKLPQGTLGLGSPFVIEARREERVAADLETARSVGEELEAIAGTFGSKAL
jgi:hypothetical protein